jgi:hypothetical protein
MVSATKENRREQRGTDRNTPYAAISQFADSQGDLPVSYK